MSGMGSLIDIGGKEVILGGCKHTLCRLAFGSCKPRGNRTTDGVPKDCDLIQVIDILSLGRSETVKFVARHTQNYDSLRINGCQDTEPLWTFKSSKT